jgi:hypothetical protein
MFAVVIGHIPVSGRPPCCVEPVGPRAPPSVLMRVGEYTLVAAKSNTSSLGRPILMPLALRLDLRQGRQQGFSAMIAIGMSAPARCVMQVANAREFRQPVGAPATRAILIASGTPNGLQWPSINSRSVRGYILTRGRGEKCRRVHARSSSAYRRRAVNFSMSSGANIKIISTS